jgi:hypothetical protein
MNIKKSLAAILAAVSTFALSACFQHETVIHLKKDGSGTIVEETRMSGQMLAMMNQFAAGFGGEENAGGAAAKDPVADMLSAEKANERAAQIGEGVTVEKIEPATVGASKGARITYRFADINKIRLSTSDTVSPMAAPGGMPEATKPAAEEKKPITFSYKDGTLVIRTDTGMKPDKETADVEKPEMPENAAENEEAMAMMKQMFADMKVSIKLVADSGIDDTDASHRDGDSITLMEMDMGKLMENMENLKKLTAIDQNDPAAAMEAIKGIEGVKAEVKPEVTVKLK